MDRSDLSFREYRRSKLTRSPASVSTPARASFSFAETAKCVGLSVLPATRQLTFHLTNPQVFRFASSKNASLFLQRKNPRKIAWTQVYRRMHKKGITEEVAKKRSRRTVKHQRGIVGADLAAIAAKRNQTTAVRSQARLQAISKAKTEKKDKETKKAKVRAKQRTSVENYTHTFLFTACSCTHNCTASLEAADEGWQGRSLIHLYHGSGSIFLYGLCFQNTYALPACHVPASLDWSAIWFYATGTHTWLIYVQSCCSSPSCRYRILQQSLIMLRDSFQELPTAPQYESTRFENTNSTLFPSYKPIH